MDEELRLRFGTLERAEETLWEIESETGVSQTDAAGMVSAVVNKGVRAHANETAFLQPMFERAAIQAPLFYAITRSYRCRFKKWN